MQGIITRSDAVKADPEYAAIVGRYTRLRAVERLRDALPWYLVQNYLNGVYHDTGMHHYAPPYGLMWRIPASMAPKRVKQAIDAPSVCEHVLTIITQQRQVIEEGRPIIDLVTDHRVGHSPDRPYEDLLSVVKVEHIVTSGYAPDWQYTFNVYELAVAILDDLESFIRKTMKRRLVPFTQLSLISEHLRRLDNNVDLVAHEAQSLIWHDSDPDTYERKEGTPVNALYRQYEQIRKRSDLCVSFAEGHLYQWMSGTAVGNPLPPLRDGQDGLLTFTALWHRQSYWRLIDRTLASRGFIVINGVRYSNDDGLDAGELDSDGPAPVEVVNLIGVPARQPNGTVVEPEPWARLESNLVRYYAGYRSELARDALLERYYDEDPLVRQSPQKKLERLNYVLGINSLDEFVAMGGGTVFG